MIQKPTYFELKELICPDVFKFYGETSWQFFDPRLFVTIDKLRERLNKAMFVNNWNEGGEFTQRGFRCIQCQLEQDAFKNNKMYCSPHSRGQAIYFDVQGLVAEEVRQYIIKNPNLLPYPVRLEAGVNWVHMDVVDNYIGDKVVLFNP